MISVSTPNLLCPVCKKKVAIRNGLIIEHMSSKQLCYGSFMPEYECEIDKPKVVRRASSSFSVFGSGAILSGIVSSGCIGGGWIASGLVTSGAHDNGRVGGFAPNLPDDNSNHQGVDLEESVGHTSGTLVFPTRTYATGW